MALSNDKFERLKELTLEQSGTSERSFAQDAGEDIAGIAEGVTEDFSQTTKDIGEGIAQGQSPFSTGLQFAGGVGRTIGSVVGRTVEGAGKAVLTEGAEEKVGDVIEEAVAKVVGFEPVEEAISSYRELEKNSPETARNLRAGFGIVEGLLELGGLGLATRPAKAGVRAVGRGIGSVGESTRGLARKIEPSGFKTLINKVPTEDADQLIEIVLDHTKGGLVTNKSSITKIEKLARSAGVSEDDLLRSFIREGGVPDVQDEFARYGGVIDDFESRQDALGSAIDSALKPLDGKPTSLASLRESAEAQLRSSPQIGADLNQSLGELDRMIASLQNRFGDTLTPQQVNQIRIQMNRKTGAFKGEQFLEDTENALAGAARGRIDEIVGDPIIREANAKWGELQGMKQIANALNNQKIQVEDIARSIGSFAGTAAASAAGFSIAGPGGLVVAFLAARQGSKALAKFLRNRRFSPEVKKIITDSLKSDEELVRELLRRAEGDDKEILIQALREQ